MAAGTPACLAETTPAVTPRRSVLACVRTRLCLRCAAGSPTLSRKAAVGNKKPDEAPESPTTAHAPLAKRTGWYSCQRQGRAGGRRSNKKAASQREGQQWNCLAARTAVQRCSTGLLQQQLAGSAPSRAPSRNHAGSEATAGIS